MVARPQHAPKFGPVLLLVAFSPRLLERKLVCLFGPKLAAAVLDEPIYLSLSGFTAQRFPIRWLQRFPFRSLML